MVTLCSNTYSITQKGDTIHHQLCIAFELMLSFQKRLGNYSGFKCFVTFCLPEHENHVCQVYSIWEEALESNIVSILWGKTVHPLSKMCFLVAVPYFPVFPCMSKLWHLKSLRSKCFVQFWTSTAMEFRSLSNGQTLSSVPWIRALPSTLLSLQPLVPPTSNVYLDLRCHIPTAEIKYWFLRKL